MEGRRIYSFPLPVQVEPIAVFAAFHDQPYSLFFDSAARTHHDSRFSYILFAPFETITAQGRALTVTRGAQDSQSVTGDPFAFLEQRLTHYGLPRKTKQSLPPFQGGAAGYFGYDLARVIERLPARPDHSHAPDMMIGLYDQIIAFDHETSEALYMVWADNEKQAQDRFTTLKTTRLTPEKTERPSHRPDALPQWHAALSQSAYEDAIRKTIDYICAGDIFQANLSQRFDAALPHNFDPFAHYAHLRSVSPAPFGAYMNFGALKIASISPERFIRVQDRQVETKPIKGTRPRGATLLEDATLKGALENSVKDRAENTMIVDLLRNDLSKNCEDHSLDVPKLCALESFSHVHHLVSTVTATLRIDKTPLDLLRGAFPGGSITGAPKIRAMEIIEELETHPRGPYCGALGYIGFDGTMDTNIAIRTLVYEGDHVHFNVGGGITVHSDPAAEYQETLDKAQGLLDSFSQNKQEDAA